MASSTAQVQTAEKPAADTISVRYLDLNPDLVSRSSLMSKDAVEEIKRRLLSRMHILPGAGESYAHAWLRVMCEENGLTFSLPVPTELAHAISTCPGAARFLWFLS